MKKIILFLFSPILLQSVSAQIPQKASLDSLFDILGKYEKSMGSITLTYKGIPVYHRTIGSMFINKEVKVPAPDQARYKIGSITKMFTSVMIFQLIQEKKLDTGTRLSTFFPGIPNAKKISIGMMLNHHSGIPNFTNDPDYKFYMLKKRTHEEMLAGLYAVKPSFEPGAKAEYSNSNYLLLGYILEQLTHKSYAENLQTRICKRIGLNSTYTGGKVDTSKQECYSYRFAGSWAPQPETDMTVAGGAGNIVSTSDELCKFINALFSYKLLDSLHVQEMIIQTDKFGFGIFSYPFGSHRAYGHTGGIDGFSSIITTFPEDSLSLAYTSNAQIFPVNDILIGVLSIWFGMPYEMPDFSTQPSALQLSPEQLAVYTGDYESELLPIKVTISLTNGILFAQAKGQNSFPLTPSSKNKFRFDQAGLTLEFIPENNQMLLKQGGGTYIFTRSTEIKK